MKHLNNEWGVAFILEVVLVAIVLAVVGVAVYASHQSKTMNGVKVQPSTVVTTTQTPNATANWTKFSSSTGKFSLSYSPSWKAYTNNSYALSTCQKDATDNVLNIDTLKSTNTVIGCGGGPIGQVHISSDVGAKNGAASFSTDANLYTNMTSEAVTIDGVEGVRYSTTSLQNLMQIEKGGKVVEYDFYANGRNYTLIMEQHASSGDIISDFDQMVKTLKFSS